MSTKNLVLIAEDDDISYQFLNTVFGRFNVQCIRAKNGTEAIEMCKTNPDINLVMMDIKMPKLDGLSATKEIKAFRPELVVVAQTAYALNSEKAELLREGCDDYISKPIDMDLLVNIVKKYLSF
ncbi:MAG: response regulator [Candidatus Kapabacteria bacterium]|nr:response regulator [Ignavibacteriota bacterium]MCW5885505.1 response regulator [Candidatus Kapabacteria bacterium]